MKSLSDGSLNWSPRLRKAAHDLESELLLLDKDGFSGETFAKAVEAESLRRLSAFADGVLKYRSMPYLPPVSAASSPWKKGTARLLDYAPDAGRKAKPVLFIPSLVNRGYILDLTEKQSLLRYLAANGVKPFLMDWDTPGPEELTFSLDDYVTERLIPALEVINQTRKTGVAVVGYCMGGLLALALARLRPDLVTSLTLMATPWDFHAIDPAKTRTMEAMIPSLSTLIDALGHMPVDVIQAMFASLDPQMTPKKFQAFSQLAQSNPKAQAFTALEDWLNDGVPLPAKVAKACLSGWYVDNLPGRNLWTVNDLPIRPEDVDLPTYVVVPKQDHIVPAASSLPLADKIPGASLLTVRAGHIGMVAGRQAVKTLYTPILKWLLEED